MSNSNVKTSNPMKVITGPNTRWSYANVWEPKSINGGTPKYSVSLIIPKSDTKTVAKIKAAIQAAYEQGKVQVNHNWFLGYTKDEDGKLIIEPAQAEIVRRIYREYLEGSNFRQIKESLENDGIKNGAGHLKWQESNIKQILTNEKYIGDALLQKTWTYNTLEKKRRKNKTDAPQYYVADNHEAIISKETFAAVQQEMIRRANLLGNSSKKRVYSGRYVFTGLLFCGKCGDVFRRFVWDIHGRKQSVWRCVTRVEYGTDACFCRTMPEDMLEGIIIKAINKVYTARQNGTALISSCLEEAFNDDTMEKVTSLDEKVKALQVELIGYKADSDEAHKLGLEIIALREERDKLLAETALQKQRVKEIEEMAKVFDGLSGPLQTYDESHVRQLINRIDIYDDKVTITFKDGQGIDINE